MKRLEGKKGQIVRVSTLGEENIEELERTFEVIEDSIYEFFEGIPLSEGGMAVRLYCKPPENGVLHVTTARQLDTMAPGKLIWAPNKNEFAIIDHGLDAVNKEVSFLFMPFPTEEESPPCSYYSTEASLPMTAEEAYNTILRLANLFDITNSPAEVSNVAADLMTWLTQAYKIAEINSDHCEFANLFYNAALNDSRWATIIQISAELEKMPFDRSDIEKKLLDEDGSEE